MKVDYYWTEDGEGTLCEAEFVPAAPCEIECDFNLCVIHQGEPCYHLTSQHEDFYVCEKCFQLSCYRVDAISEKRVNFTDFAAVLGEDTLTKEDYCDIIDWLLSLIPYQFNINHYKHGETSNSLLISCDELATFKAIAIFHKMDFSLEKHL